MNVTDGILPMLQCEMKYSTHRNADTHCDVLAAFEVLRGRSMADPRC